MRWATSQSKYDNTLADMIYMKKILHCNSIYDLLESSNNSCKTTRNKNMITVLEKMTPFL